jgi:hypothetical protein
VVAEAEAPRAKVKPATERPASEGGPLRSDASDEARKQKRGAAALPVIERKQTPSRPAGGAGPTGARPDTAARPQRNSFPAPRTARASTPFPPAGAGAPAGSSRPAHRAPSTATASSAPAGQGGFGPPRRFVAHPLPGRAAASPGDDHAADEDSRDRRPAARAEPSAFGPPSARLKSPPFRPGGPRPGGFQPDRGRPGGFGHGAFKTGPSRATEPSFKSGGGGKKSGDFKASGFKSGGFKSRPPAPGGSKAGFGAARPRVSRDGPSTGSKFNRPHGK